MADYAPVLRMAERLLVTVFGGMSIFLGYKLLMSGVLAVASGEWKGLGVRVKLTRASPGIFFCLFGCLILLQALYTKVEVKGSDSFQSLSSVLSPRGKDTEQQPGTAPRMTGNRPLPSAAKKIQNKQPAGTVKIEKETRFLGVTNTAEWDRLISSVNLAISTLEKSNSSKEVAALKDLREVILRAAFGDADYEFYTGHRAGKLDGLTGALRAKWFALDRRAKILPTVEGEKR